MTPRERYFAVLDGSRPDVLPRIPILMQFAAEHVGSHYGLFASDYRVLTEANLRCAHDFGLDQLSAISDPYRETAGFGAQVEFPLDRTPFCSKAPLEDNPDVEQLPQPDPWNSPRMRDRINAVGAMHARGGTEYSVLGWVEGPAAEAADLRGVTNFLIDLIDDAAYAERLMARCVETALAFAKAQVKSGADTIGVGDAIASQVSRATYEALILPFERHLVTGLHALGVRVRLHICGNITHLLPGIATLGLDIVDLDHTVDLASARAVLGSRVVLAGNLDPVSVVMRGSPESIRAAVLACQAAAGAPYMVAAGCEVPAATPPANLLALCTPVPPG